MNDNLLKLENQICFRLYKNSRAMIRLYQPYLEPLGLSYPQYITMLVLWENEVIDFKHLGESLELKTGTLSPILRRLEEMNLILREKNGVDQRKIWVTLTDMGRELKKRAISVPRELSKLLQIDLEQYKGLIEELDRLSTILNRSEQKK